MSTLRTGVMERGLTWTQHLFADSASKNDGGGADVRVRFFSAHEQNPLREGYPMLYVTSLGLARTERLQKVIFAEQRSGSSVVARRAAGPSQTGTFKGEPFMKKMSCLFQRDFTDRRNPVLLLLVTPGSEWVLSGEGIATRKRDGTACLVQEGKLFKRYDAKKGKAPPQGFVPCQPEPDATTGHWPGWLEVDDGPESKWHREAWTGLRVSDGTRFREAAALSDGTYELCGPKIQGNPEGLEEHMFIRHGSEVLELQERTWLGLRDFLQANPIEGIVWHHPDGRMVKLRRDDYGFSWPAATAD